MIYKIEDVLEDIKNGIPLIIVDDENRENEGDLFVAAEKATYESINLMATYARGLTCTPMSSEYAVRLNLDPMTARILMPNVQLSQYQLMQKKELQQEFQ